MNLFEGNVHAAHIYIGKSITSYIHLVEWLQAAASSIEKYFQEEVEGEKVNVRMRYFLQQQANEWESIKKNFPILKFSSSNRQCHHTFIRMQRTVVNMNANGYNGGFTVVLTLRAHRATQNFEIMKNEKKKNIIHFMFYRMGWPLWCQ